MKALEMLRAVLGYAWAILCLVFVLATFIGLNFWSQTLADGTDLQVSPWFTGGEIRQNIDHGAYHTRLHRPVFDGLLGERSEGFVQIEWVPNKDQSLPALIDEEFDVDVDGTVEFRVRLDTVAARAEVRKYKPWVLDADNVIPADNEQILRIRLRNPDR